MSKIEFLDHQEAEKTPNQKVRFFLLTLYVASVTSAEAVEHQTGVTSLTFNNNFKDNFEDIFEGSDMTLKLVEGFFLV